MVDDAFIGMSFNRNSRELISLGNRGLSSWRGRESEKESRFDFDMTKERAHELMSKYMTAIEGGFPERLGGLDEDRFTSMAERAKTDGGRISTRADISATWPRTHEGVPFFSIDDSTWISICAVTGELMVYKKERRSLPPEEMEVNITQEEALKMAKDITAEEIRFKARIDPDNIRIDTEGRLFASIAAYEEALEQKREYLKEEAKYWLVYTGIEPQLDGEPELMIVNPNIAYTEKYHQDSPLKDRWNPQTKLAWVITLTYTPADEDEQRLRPLKMMVWIEAADGEVIGGELPY